MHSALESIARGLVLDAGNVWTRHIQRSAYVLEMATVQLMAPNNGRKCAEIDYHDWGRMLLTRGIVLINMAEKEAIRLQRLGVNQGYSDVYSPDELAMFLGTCSAATTLIERASALSEDGEDGVIDTIGEALGLLR